MQNMLPGTTALNALPYFNMASMSINGYDTSVTRRLLQCTDWGLDMMAIWRLFQRPGVGQTEDYLERKKVVESYDNGRSGRRQWIPIMYEFELADGTATKAKDYGHLVFTNGTFTEFLIVMCYVLDEYECEHSKGDLQKDYDEQVQYQADRFMSLLLYLFHRPEDRKPKLVRATYTTRQQGILTEFLAGNSPVAHQGNIPAIAHVTVETFKLSLQSRELFRIDKQIEQSPSWAHHKAPPTRQNMVLANSPRPKPTDAHPLKHKISDKCAQCHKMQTRENGQKGMSECSRCKIVRYCSKRCQQAHWPYHKLVCHNSDSGKTSAYTLAPPNDFKKQEHNRKQKLRRQKAKIEIVSSETTEDAEVGDKSDIGGLISTWCLRVILVLSVLYAIWFLSYL